MMRPIPQMPPFPGSVSASGVSRRTFLCGGAAFLTFSAAPLRAACLPFQLSVEDPSLCLTPRHPSHSPLLEKFISKLDPDADDFAIERHCKRLQQVLESWSVSLCAPSRSIQAVHDSLAESLTASSPRSARRVPLRTDGPLTIERVSFDAPHAMGRTTFSNELHEYLSTLSEIVIFESQIFALRTLAESPRKVATDVRFNLAGSDLEQGRAQRAGTWKITWLNEAGTSGDSDRWLVDGWTFEEEIRSALAGPGFVDVTAQSMAAQSMAAQLAHGIDYWRTRIDGATGIDVYGNHGIAVGDIDGSGFDSFYVCQPSGLPNRLFRNRGDGTFEDITAASGTGILDGTASALFVDFQNKGLQDLLVVRSSGPLLFTNLGHGRFEPSLNAFHFARSPQGTFAGAAAADYNRDGFVDIYLCLYSYYKGLNHHQYPSPYYDAQNGPPNYLFRNRGDGTFEDVTAESGMDANNNRFSFAAAWCDYDNDGWPDIYVANDFGRKNLYRNNRDGTFTDVAASAGVEDYGPGMSVCWLDRGNDGLQDIYVANMWLAEGLRITGDKQFLPGVAASIRELYQKHNAGNSLYRNLGGGRFEDRTAQGGMAIAGWSWSCASWDFDNDGWPDVYVANGFVSAPDRYDLQSFFWRQVVQRSLTPAGVSPEYEAAWNAVNELLRSDYSWSGYQRNVFFANNRDGTFSEVSAALGLDILDDSRAFGLSDFDHDGRLEFVLKNRTGPQLRIFRNSMEGLGNSIVICLRGTVSNRDAIGAVVTITSGAPRQAKFVSAGGGFASQHTKEMAFGLGAHTDPVSISITWPTGVTSRYDGLPVNHRVYIEEGSLAVEARPYRADPSAREEVTKPAASPDEADAQRTWLVAPLFGPELCVTGQDGVRHRLSELRGRPAVLTFVRPGCNPSARQLEQLQEGAGQLAEAGIALLAVLLSSGDNSAPAWDTAHSDRAAFPLHLADDAAIKAWTILYRYMFDRRRQMPFPASFLLNKDGAVIRSYIGSVAPAIWIDDWNTAPKTPEQQLARAMPFAGPYFGEQMKHDYLTFGIAYSQNGLAEDARDAFQHAVDANPALEVAWFNLGTVQFNLRNYSEARRCLSQAVLLKPEDSDAWNNLGSLSGAERKYDEALEEFQRAALIDPHHANAVENMMRIYRLQNRASDAQKALEELLKRAPADPDLHIQLANALVAQGKLDEARLHLETSLRLRAENPDALDKLGAVLLRLGLTGQAIDRFEECRRVAPDFDRPVINEAHLYIGAGKNDKAAEIVNEFLVRHPDDSAVRKVLDSMASDPGR